MRWLALALALAGCRSAYELTQPIDVVSASSWTDAQRMDLANAAECWNLGFGIDYEPAKTSDLQRVTVKFDDLLCLDPDTWGLTTTGFESDVALCSYDFEPVPRYEGSLFGVLTHELGHVAGILVIVDDDVSIMGGETAISIASHIGQPMFSATDHALFSSYNSDFTPQPTCDPVIEPLDAGTEYGPDAAFQCVCP